MDGYYFSYEVSQDGTKTLVVYDVQSGLLSSTPRVVKVVTGKAATRLYNAMTSKERSIWE